jgi:hypothetical protein
MVNELELNQGCKLDNDVVNAVYKLLMGVGSFIEQKASVWHGSGYHGHLLALAQYELAIRAAHETEEELRRRLLNHVPCGHTLESNS